MSAIDYFHTQQQILQQKYSFRYEKIGFHIKSIEVKHERKLRELCETFEENMNL